MTVFIHYNGDDVLNATVFDDQGREVECIRFREGHPVFKMTMDDIKAYCIRRIEDREQDSQ